MTPDTENQNAQPKLSRPPVRWWPVIVILILASIAVIYVRSITEFNHQRRNLLTANIIFWTTVSLLGWCLILSRWRWVVRLSVCGAFLGGVALAVGLFRFRGVTGDLLPVLEWRWKSARVVEHNRLTTTNVLDSPLGKAAAIALSTNDYPQFLGPNRNACVIGGPLLARDWKAQPPREIWRHPVGAAWSGFAVANHYAITQEQQAEKELVVCYDLMSGKLIWSHADRARYNTTLAGEGPRATPTITGRYVFTQGATGILNCLDLFSGKMVWSKNILADNQSKAPGWGMSGSPLVWDDWVIVSAGGHDGHSLVAYQVGTGNSVWAGGSDSVGYSSPCKTYLAGMPQVLIFNDHELTGHDYRSGQVLWHYPWPATHPHVAIPVVLPNNRVLISSGYGTGSALLQIEKGTNDQWSASLLWKSRRLKAKFTNVVYREGFIYGLDDGILVCLDSVNGEQRWKAGRYGHGQVILVNDLLLVMAENGEVVLVEPVPQEHRELSRFKAFTGKTWNPPALAGPYLLARTDQEAACFCLPTVQPK